MCASGRSCSDRSVRVPPIPHRTRPTSRRQDRVASSGVPAPRSWIIADHHVPSTSGMCTIPRWSLHSSTWQRCCAERTRDCSSAGVPVAGARWKTGAQIARKRFRYFVVLCLSLPPGCTNDSHGRCPCSPGASSHWAMTGYRLRAELPSGRSFWIRPHVASLPALPGGSSPEPEPKTRTGAGLSAASLFARPVRLGGCEACCRLQFALACL